MPFDGQVTPELLKELQRLKDPFAFGYTPSGARQSDFLQPLVNVPHALPPTIRHPAFRKVPMKNQQGSTCVSNSCALSMTMNEYVETGEVVNFDAEAWSGRAVALDYGEGAAASPHDLLDDAMKHGVPATVGSQQGLYFPKGYAWVDYKNSEAIKTAISTPRTAVTFAVWLLSNFGAGAGTEFAHDIPGEQPWGLHEITAVGYDPEGVVFQNSWGTWWGDGGFGRLAWDYLAARGTEMLTITDSEDNLKGYVKTFNWGSGAETAIAHEDLPNRKRPAVYLVKPNGRIWIKDPVEAKRFGVKLPPVRVPDTDGRWGLPVIGPDAPANLR